MTLKNSFHTQLAIGILLNDEKELEAKLNMLTEIGLTASNKETFKICEDFRERLCRKEVAQERADYLPPKGTMWWVKRSSRNEVSDADNGDE